MESNGKNKTRLGNEPQQAFYQQLKQHHWQPNLRLEQQRTHLSLLQAALATPP